MTPNNTASSHFQVMSSEFLLGTRSVNTLPPLLTNEVAIVGRSNVGKSSLINRLCSRKGLARTSNTPGRTQEINLFNIGVRTGKKNILELTLVDLPGFGYAKLPHRQRAAIAQMVAEYLEIREQLLVTILLNDCRRLPQIDELAVREACANRGGHLIIVLTKTDKVGRAELTKQRKAIARAYDLEPEDLILASEKLPCTPIWQRLVPLLS